MILLLSSKNWAVSSAGRAPALHAGGQRFDPATVHHEKRLRFLTGIFFCIKIKTMIFNLALFFLSHRIK